MLGKKAQIGETITWVVATIIVIVILVVAIFIVSSSPFKGGKKFEYKNTKTDLLVTKSFMGYLLSKDSSGVQVFEQLKDKKTYLEDPKEGGKIEKSNLDLAMKIFPVLYGEEYSDNFWIGIVKEECGWNKFKGSNEQPSCSPIQRKSFTIGYIRISCDRVNLKEDNTVELILNKPTRD